MRLFRTSIESTTARGRTVLGLFPFPVDGVCSPEFRSQNKDLKGIRVQITTLSRDSRS